MRTFKLKMAKRLYFTSPEDQFEQVGCTSKVRKGRCPRCHVVYVWAIGKMRLRDARCPGCNVQLDATTWYVRSSPWYRCDVVEVK